MNVRKVKRNLFKNRKNLWKKFPPINKETYPHGYLCTQSSNFTIRFTINQKKKKNILE